MIKQIHYCEEYSHAVALYDDTWDAEDISLVVNNIHKDETVALTAGDLQDLMVIAMRLGGADKQPNGTVSNIVRYLGWCIGNGYDDYYTEQRCRAWMEEEDRGKVAFYTVTFGSDDARVAPLPLPRWFVEFVAGSVVPNYANRGTIVRKQTEGKP